MPQRPNIVQIVVDDMGYGDLGCFGNADVHTPALDALADQGVSLLQHYSASPVCAPARAGLLTGRYPHRTGAIDTLEGRGLDRLAPREVTLADHLKAAGYATGLVGKWHLGAFEPEYHPNRRGFDAFVGFRGGWSDYFDYHYEVNSEPHRSDGTYMTDLWTREAMAFLRRHRDEPFYLHLAYNAPHFPLQAPDEVVQKYRDLNRFTEGVCRIYAMNEIVDRGVAQVVETLDDLRLRGNTLVMFTSDNGPDQSHGHTWFGPDQNFDVRRFNAGWRGSKGNVFEGGVRVPCIVHWADGGIVGGGRSNELVHFNDWLPTLLSAADVSPLASRPVDGSDALSALRGESSAVSTRRFWQWNRYRPSRLANAAMRDGEWKLVRPPVPGFFRCPPEDAQADYDLRYHPERVPAVSHEPLPEPQVGPDDVKPPLLFNLSDDPYEQHDLASEHPERAARMQRELDAWFEEVEAERAAITPNAGTQ